VKRPSLRLAGLAVAVAALAGGALAALAQDDAASPRSAADAAQDEIRRYREMLADGNPAELVELQGEALWSTPRGPKHASLEACDLGLGPGVVDGAYAQLPRWFDDAQAVQDIESRVVHCMVTLQGFTREQATAGWFKPGSDVEALSTFVAARSKGLALAAPVAHPREAALLEAGEDLFWRRAGPLDFACATCHAAPDRRIRLQELPDLRTADGARESLTRWPAYRMSQSHVWTLERRLIDCIRQMRWPEPEFGSEAVVALEVWLHHQAQGGVLDNPGLKR
jgi:sulfur-oxidizing protein SoxA